MESACFKLDNSIAVAKVLHKTTTIYLARHDMHTQTENQLGGSKCLVWFGNLETLEPRAFIVLCRLGIERTLS